MEDLLQAYKETQRIVNKAKDKAKAEGREEDRALLADCATGISYIISYLEHGREPGNRRSITRYAGYQREVPVDPGDIDFIKRNVLAPVWGKPKREELSSDQLELLEDLLARLTLRERDAFVMVRGRGYSYSEAAELMHVKKTSLQNMVERAEKKLYFVVRKPSNSERNISSRKLYKPVQRVLFPVS